MIENNYSEEYRQLKQAVDALEDQRSILGDAVVEAALGPMQKRLAELDFTESKSTLTFEGERKLVTVMFADISGFTPLSEKLDPENVRELVNACFDRLVPIIEKYGGMVEKFIGDEIMAIFGAPVAYENDPERAIRTALEMMEELAVFSADHKINFGMHIGIGTGMVIAGGIGSDGQQQYGVLGDAVSLAKRLVDASEQGEIVVGPVTYRLTASLFDFDPFDPILVKGKGELIQSYIVQRAKPRTFHSGTWGIQGINTRTIGREAELINLQEWLNTAMVNRQTTLVTVLGEAGVGKSRLLYEFENWLELQPGERMYFKVRCTQQRQGVANSLLRDLFAFRFGISDSDPIEVVRGKLEAGVTEFLPEQGGMKAHFLGAWLGYDYGNSLYVAALRGDAEQLHNQASLYLGQFFTALSVNSPAVILLEDLHWADSGSLNTLVDLCRRRPGLPLFILSLARPELIVQRPGWGSDLLETRYEQVDIYPLTEPDVRMLVGEIFKKVTQVPSILVDFLVNRAEGNPYYLEELVQMLIDQKVILTNEDKWQVMLEKLAELQVPDTLKAVLQARLDQLSQSQKQALQQAAVVGRVFWDAVLAEFGVKVDVRLAELASRALVIPQPQSAFTGTSEYIFKHALLRDVTYESMLIKARRIYHRLVGAWLAKVVEDNGRTDEYAAIIGGHYEAAGDMAVAGTWYGQAGKRAAGQFDRESAEKWLSRALDLISVEERAIRYELLLAREGIYHLAGEREKQFSDLFMLAELAGVTSETADLHPEWSAWVLIRWAAYARAVSDYPAAIKAAAEALVQAEAITDGRLAASALACWGDALWRQGEYATAQKQFAEGQFKAKCAGAQAELADNLKGLGIVAYEQGYYQGAKEYYGGALEIYKEIGDRRGESACLGNLGLVAADLRDFVDAREYHEASLGIVREIGYRRGEGICLNNLGVVARDQGDYNRALEYHNSSLEICKDIGYRRGESICLVNLGVAALNQGDCVKALGYYEASLEIAREVGYRAGEGLVLHDLGMLAEAEGNPAKAETYFRQALTIHEHLGQPQHVVEDQAELACVALDRCELATARLTLTPVLIYLKEHPTLEGSMHPYRLPIICGRVLLALGELTKARAVVEITIQTWAALAEKLPTLAERERFRKMPEYEALHGLWVEITEKSLSCKHQKA